MTDEDDAFESRFSSFQVAGGREHANSRVSAGSIMSQKRPGTETAMDSRSSAGSMMP